MYVVGKILRPHGIKGSVKVEIITSFPEHFAKLKQLYSEFKNQWQTYSIESARLTGRFVILQFSEVKSIDEAEALRGKLLHIKEEELQALSEDEYYIHDLIGLNVFNEQDDQLIGEIIDIETNSCNDIYVVKAAEGREYMIPAIKDIVRKVDCQNGKMTIHVMEGLLD